MSSTFTTPPLLPPVWSSARARAWFAAAALGVGSLASSGCIEDPDCGICDPDNLILTSISGTNYAGKKIHIVSPNCEGERCPEPFEKANYFVETIRLCDTTDESKDSARPGDEGYCRLAPIVVRGGLEFVFNNLLKATSIELVRKDPTNPQLFEIYDWKNEIAYIEGPITRFNGDVFLGQDEEPDVITRYVNLSCVDNLRLKGQPFDNTSYENPDTNPCNTLDPDTGLPMKMWTQVEPPAGYPPARVASYGGEWDERGGSCDTPQSGPDTCCSSCDFELSVNVAKYGVMPGTDVWRNPNEGNALECDPTGNKYEQCAGFETWTNREDEVRSYTYGWTAPDAKETFKIPYFDKLRETHPDQRPQWLEARDAAPGCSNTDECRDPEVHNLPGTECVGTKDVGGSEVSCQMGSADPECTGGVCLAEWFVTCRLDANTTGSETGYCVDRRFNSLGAGACYETTAAFKKYDPDNKVLTDETWSPRLLAYCDGDENTLLSAAECCQASLGSSADGEACDPLFQPQVRPVSRFTRNSTLPDETRACVCRSDYETFYAGAEARTCREMVAQFCTDENGKVRPERDGDYAVKFVTKVGGVVYDPAIKGIDFRPAHIGNQQRAKIEFCSENRSNGVGKRNVRDGWRLNDPFVPHSFEDFDRAICSDQEYTVVFNAKGSKKMGLDENGNPVEVDAQVVEDKVGNDLSGKQRYTFRTSQFHVVPDSGFPSTNLRIGACDSFQLSFSNKYDMSPENLAKIRIVELPTDPDGNPISDVDSATLPVVAGGPNCAPTQDELAPDRPPCLTVDVGDQWRGIVRVLVDTTAFTEPALQTGTWYRMWVPGLVSRDEMNDPGRYKEAFWDVCGMPLIVGAPGSDEFVEGLYDFLIDPPKCEEDKDFDNVPFSCDNADDHFNPNQENADGDLFGDVVDLCPLIKGTNNTADSDRDGVGNDCDNCRRAITAYNTDAADSIKAYMRVRNVPFQSDADEDGIGDVCDNCVTVANCDDYGPSNPYSQGDPINFEDANLCQRDDNDDMIGNACEGMMDPNAAGPIGFDDSDDFDQDGIANLNDACPRQPVTVEGPVITCADNTECPVGRVCTPEGLCDHTDRDKDRVGDMCDTCPFKPNPLQVMEGGMQEDDEDEDFVGKDCETNSACYDAKDPRPFAFHEVSVNGYCCITRLPTPTPCTGMTEGECGFGKVCDPMDNMCRLADPDGVPIRLSGCSDADEEAGLCRQLPVDVAERPGVGVLPDGCDQALMDAGLTKEENATVLTPDDFGGDIDALWAKMCFLPQWDQDFDGIGDICDLCPFAYDPENQPFVNENGKVDPKFGKFCNGDYAIENVCEGFDMGGGGSTGGTGGTAGTGGTGGTGGSTGG